MPNIPSAQSVTSDERLLAALAHGSGLLPGFGFVGPLVVWLSQRQKSLFVAYHALQALTYQLLQWLYWIVVSVVGIIFFTGVIVVLGLIIGASHSADDSLPFLAILGPQFILFGFFALALVLYMGLSLLGAVWLLTGHDFKYPLLGGWLHNYLEAAPAEIVNDRADHYAAALAHGAVLLPAWGLIVPLVMWLSQGQRSLVLRFQALQAFLYQLISLGVMLVLGGCQFFGWMFLFPLSILATLMLTSLPREMAGAGSVGAALLFSVLLGGGACLNLLQLVSGPLFVLGGLWGANRTLASQNFSYPLIGAWVRRRQAGGPALDETQPL